MGTLDHLYLSKLLGSDTKPVTAQVLAQKF